MGPTGQEGTGEPAGQSRPGLTGTLGKPPFLQQNNSIKAWQGREKQGVPRGAGVGQAPCSHQGASWPSLRLDPARVEILDVVVLEVFLGFWLFMGQKILPDMYQCSSAGCLGRYRSQARALQ